MKIKKSFQLYLIFDVLLFIFLVGLIIAAVRDFQRFGVITVFILGSVYHFFRHQYRLSKHYIQLDQTRLKVEDGKHSIIINTRGIKSIDYANHIMIIKLDGMEYRFDLYGYDVKKVEILIGKAKSMIADNKSVEQTS